MSIRAAVVLAALVAASAGCGGDGGARSDNGDGGATTSVTAATAVDDAGGVDGTGPAPIRIEYADHDDGFGELWLPAAATVGEPAAVVVLVHGGYWQHEYGLGLMDPLVPSLLDLGVAVWNVEYRRVGAGGGYPSTFDDIAAAFDVVGSLPPALAGRIDARRVAAVGHSAGGQLAVWAASRPELTPGVPGADPSVVPALVVSQAGVLDLAACAESGLGGGACTELVGDGSGAAPERYATTSPIELAPIGVPVVAVHGTFDVTVPIEQSTRYVDAALAAGGDAKLVTIDGEDHFDQLDPASASWAAVLAELVAWSPSG
jgi:acetyl esterase/lipase